jgi:CrcB protein
VNGLLLAALGGAFGAVARYGVGLWAVRAFGDALPYATFGVNILGGFAMGLLIGLVPLENRSAHILLGVGVLGGFTTFSAFSIELVRLFERGDAGLAIGYAMASVAASAAACYAGVLLARSLT